MIATNKFKLYLIYISEIFIINLMIEAMVNIFEAMHYVLNNIKGSIIKSIKIRQIKNKTCKIL